MPSLRRWQTVFSDSGDHFGHHGSEWQSALVVPKPLCLVNAGHGSKPTLERLFGMSGSRQAPNVRKRRGIACIGLRPIRQSKRTGPDSSLTIVLPPICVRLQRDLRLESERGDPG
jgi:hypothetical protein